MKKQETQKKITNAAWKLLQSHETNGFSMRKLAELVGMTVSSLYYHFPSKEALFAELINHASEEILFPVEERTWKGRLEKYAHHILTTLDHYPGLAQLLMDYPPSSRNYLKLLDTLLMTLSDLTMEPEEKFFAINAYMNYICTFKIDSERFQKRDNRFTEEEEESYKFLPFLTAYKKAGIFDHLGSPFMFEFGLQLILSGMEKIEADR